jgi:phosphohistidine phosphatase
MRHAKSGWPTGPGNDFDRTLTDYGNKDAASIGRWIQEHNWLPDQIICSPAKRVKQTVDHLCQQIGMDSQEVKYDKRIYEADENRLLNMLKEAKSATTRLLIVGHNPSLSDLLNFLCSDSSRPTIDKPMPAAALAVISLKSSWSVLDQGNGELMSLILPETLRR